MKILSIDVGIKNLAFCLFEKNPGDNHFQINKWDSINVANKEILKCVFIHKNQPCNNPAKFQKNDECFCLKHSKKLSYQIPNTELRMPFINKQKIQSLFEIAEKYNIIHDKNMKKTELINLISEYIDKSCFDEIEDKKSKDVDLITIGRNIQFKFDALFQETIDHVIIENQISTIASRMKSIQGMIAQYFIMKYQNSHIEFISPINKLKEFFSCEKTKYNQRKKMSIIKCLEIITNENSFQNKIQYFNSHKKKDDLADSFLQGLWYIHKNIL